MYERRSLLLTSNLAFSDWGQILQGERRTAALLDRLTHHGEIFEINSENFRFRGSMRENKKFRKPISGRRLYKLVHRPAANAGNTLST
ncbi:MAG TPA: ATP-binding protein [Planctomycetaceae bacterium]|nr:ATP-binding protein [Planctomycetaceae bacterium]HQZ64461.1 ATP-binding protein [Planctomycetaceae bacterium]HRA87509.1 ATP-binding protein [Planctomycetaceae bacterium]